jgi:hypothetical protein
VSVDFVIVIELDENNTVIAQQNISYALADGDSFEYVSSIQVDPSTFPSAIQLNVYGSNAAGDTIVSFVAVSFTKNCAAYPVFMDTFSLGWIQFVSTILHVGGVVASSRETQQTIRRDTGRTRTAPQGRLHFLRCISNSLSYPCQHYIASYHGSRDCCIIQSDYGTF